MSVQGVHEPGNPADAALEESELYGRESIQYAAENQPRRAHHVSQWKSQRRGEMREPLVTLCTHQPGMTVLRFENSRARMNEDRNIQPSDLFVERPQHFIIEIPVRPATAELDRFHAQVLDRPAQFANRLLDIRQINPGTTDEPIIAADIFGSGFVVCACQLPPEFGIELIDQHPVVRDQNLNIETVLFHEFCAQLRTPTSFFE